MINVDLPSNPLSYILEEAQRYCETNNIPYDPKNIYIEAFSKDHIVIGPVPPDQPEKKSCVICGEQMEPATPFGWENYQPYKGGEISLEFDFGSVELDQSVWRGIICDGCGKKLIATGRLDCVLNNLVSEGCPAIKEGDNKDVCDS